VTCWNTSTVNFLTAPAGTAGSVGSTLANFSNCTPLASASVGALAGAAGAAATLRLTTVVVWPESPDEANAKTETTMARMPTSTASPVATIIHSRHVLSPSPPGAAGRVSRPSALS
jgi:hypothetical protein